MKIRFITVLVAISVLHSASSTIVHQPVVATTSPAPKKVDYVMEISARIDEIQKLSSISLVEPGTNVDGSGGAAGAAAAAVSPAKDKSDSPTVAASTYARRRSIGFLQGKQSSAIHEAKIIIEQHAREILKLWLEGTEKDPSFLEKFTMEKAIVNALYSFDDETKTLLKPLFTDISTYKIERLKHVAIKSGEAGSKRQMLQATESAGVGISQSPVSTDELEEILNGISTLVPSSAMFTGALSVSENLAYGTLTGRGVRILAVEPALNSGHKRLGDVMTIGTPIPAQAHGAHVLFLIRQNAQKASVVVTDFSDDLSAVHKQQLGEALKSTDIINISLSNGQNSESFGLIEDILSGLEKSNNSNCLLVWASSNDSYNCDEPFNPNEKYLRNVFKDPAKWKRMLLVGSLDQDACPAFYSNRPGASRDFQENFVYTHGTKVFSMGANSGYEVQMGTSMAAPSVAGCIALLVEYIRTNLNRAELVTPEFLKECILKSADKDFYISKKDFVEGFDLCVHVTDGPRASQEIQFYQSADGPKILVLVEEAYDPAVFGMGILNIESALIYAKEKLEGRNDAEIISAIKTNNARIVAKYKEDERKASQKTEELAKFIEKKYAAEIAEVQASGITGIVEELVSKKDKALAARQNLVNFSLNDIRGQRLFSPLDYKSYFHIAVGEISAASAGGVAVAKNASPAPAASSSSGYSSSIRDSFWDAVIKKSLKILPSQNKKATRAQLIAEKKFEETPFAWMAHNRFKALAKDFFTWFFANDASSSGLEKYLSQLTKGTTRQKSLATQGMRRDIMLMLFPLVDRYNEIVLQWIKSTWDSLPLEDRAAIYFIPNPHNRSDLEYYLIQQLLFSNNEELVRFLVEDLQKNVSKNDPYQRIIDHKFDIGGVQVPLLQLGDSCLKPKLQEMVSSVMTAGSATPMGGQAAAAASSKT